MKIKDIFNIKNISNFIEGNAKYYYNKLLPFPQHIREQVLYRLYVCKDDCVKTGVCSGCGSGCPTEKKVFVNSSCNEGKKFPDFMDNTNWLIFKQQHNLNEQDIFNKGEEDK